MRRRQNQPFYCCQRPSRLPGTRHCHRLWGPAKWYIWTNIRLKVFHAGPVQLIAEKKHVSDGTGTQLSESRYRYPANVTAQQFTSTCSVGGVDFCFLDFQYRYIPVPESNNWIWIGKQILPSMKKRSFSSFSCFPVRKWVLGVKKKKNSLNRARIPNGIIRA
jgi:hypothetical protein